MESIRWIVNAPERGRRGTASVKEFAPSVLEGVRAFHATMPGYVPTPLAALPALAARLGLGSLHVKDESRRFGLKAFKVLGGSYAIARYLAGRLGLDLGDLPFPVLTGDEVKEALGEVTFATTTDGNHGRGVAWTARMLRQRAVVFMPQGSAPFRLEAIRGHMSKAGIDAALFTSYHCINYYSDFLFCYFGRRYGLLVDHDTSTSISAGIDGGQPWRRTFGGRNVTYTDWQKDNYFHAIRGLTKGVKRLGIEFDHITLDTLNLLKAEFPQMEFVDIAAHSMRLRMIKSAEEIAHISEITGRSKPDVIS